MYVPVRPKRFMIHPKKIMLIFIASLLLLGAGAAAGFYLWFGHASKRAADEYQLGTGAANAIKHAYAAASSYQLLRAGGIAPEAAKTMVRGLGYVNERAEVITKFNTPDSVAETAKDLLSNEIGLRTAQQLETAPKVSTLKALQNLSQNGCLANSEKIFAEKFAFHAVPLENEMRVETALRWFHQHEAEIAAYMEAHCHAHANMHE